MSSEILIELETELRLYLVLSVQDGSKVYLSNWLLKQSTQSILWTPISSAPYHNIYVYLYSCHARSKYYLGMLCFTS